MINCIIAGINLERKKMGKEPLNPNQEAFIRYYHEATFKEIKESDDYKKLSEDEKFRLEAEVREMIIAKNIEGMTPEEKENVKKLEEVNRILHV